MKTSSYPLTLGLALAVGGLVGTPALAQRGRAHAAPHAVAAYHAPAYNGGYYHGGYYHSHYPAYRYYYGRWYGYPGSYAYYYPYVYPSYSYYSYPVYSSSNYYMTPSAPLYVPSYPLDNVSPAAGAAPATVEIRVPVENAEVWFQGLKTTETGTVRVFTSPPLTPGRTYTYRVRAAWRSDAGAVEQARSVPVQPGQTAYVDFTRPAPEPLPAPAG
jgi:uncharacterized protein (TIGR03000 family)